MSAAARAKFQIPTAYLSPNECVGCGTTDNKNTEGRGEGMVDLGKDIDYYGVLYICGDCAREVARLFGSISPSEYTSMETALTEANAELSKLRQINLGLRKIVDGYRDYGSLVTSEFASTLLLSTQEPSTGAELLPGTDEVTGDEESSDVIIPSDDDQGTDGSRVPEVTDRIGSAGSPEVNESVDNEGPSNVRDDSGDDRLAEILNGLDS